METISKNKVISSLFWKFFERVGTKIVSLIVSIILARILAPSDYGLISLITIFITISNVFIESGFGTALIQKKDADELDFSTVFYFNVLVSILLYVILFLLAPVIAQFYNNIILIPIIRVLGFSLIISGLKSVQNAYISKNMLFKKLSVSTILGTFLSAVIGIYMAYHEYGVWALVAQQLSSVFVTTLLLWFIVKWRPIRRFSLERLKRLFDFGWKLLCSSILEKVYNELYGLVIGKIYDVESLAFYNKGQQFPALIAENVDGTISSVSLPTLSSYQDNKDKMKNMLRKAITTSSFILFPMMMGLAVVATPVISIVLTDKWLPAVPVLQLLCISYSFMPIHTANLQAINALGRSDIFLKLEIIKKIFGIIILIISIPFGIYAMAVAQIVTAAISSFINAYPNKKLLNYSYKEQCKDIIPAFLITIIMVVVIYPMKFFIKRNFILLVVQIVSGIVVYIILSKVFKLSTFEYVIQMTKDFLKEKRNKKV